MQSGDLDSSTLHAIASAPTPLTFELQVQVHDLQEHWKRCNMLANYVAEYVAYQFSEREWAENLISTVTNEFLEAISSLSPAQADLVLRCLHDQPLQGALTTSGSPSDLVIEIDHSVRPEAAQPYAELLGELSEQVTDERYLGLLTTDRPAVDFNQLGLAMIAHDFSTRIAAQFDETSERVHVQIRVPVKPGK
jgi:hypothetical protein